MTRSIGKAVSNIYEVNIRQYTPEGTFRSFATHLTRLRKMGIDVLWLMPIHPISHERKKGTLGSYYAISDYQAINPEFGTKEDFKALIVKAKSLGFRIILDWVANHTGLDHVWTRSNKEYYILSGKGDFTERNGWDDVIDLDYSNPSLRIAMKNCMHYWIDAFEIDGFRCDMAMLVPLEFWKEARRAIDPNNQLIWLGECEQIEYFEAFDLQYGWEWMHQTKKISQENLNKHQLESLIRAYQSKTPEGKKYLFFTSNHDENSWNGTEYERYGSSALFWAALSILLPHKTPLIYSGQELPLKNRLKFFDKDVIPWSSELKLEEFYTRLLELKNRFSDDLVYSLNSVSIHDYIFSMIMKDSKQGLQILIIANLGKYYTQTPVDFNHWQNENIINLLTNEEIILQDDNVISLEGGDFNIYIS